jgi:transcription initiation factor TFIIB
MQISSADKALRSAHDAIRIMADRINLTKNVTNRAYTIFKECYKNKCLRGRSHDAIITTCIYAACRDEGSDRTMKG